MEAMLGAPKTAVDLAEPVLTANNVSVRVGAATVLPLAGETLGVERVIDAAAREYATDTLTMAVSVAGARAALALERKQPRAAIEALRPAEPYELGRVAIMMPLYLRGLASLQAGDGRQAAEQFRRILQHRGVDPFSMFYALAPLGLARSLALEGDTDGSLRAYEQFFSIWKQPDPDLPVLATARREYDRLKVRTQTE
jgi:hypothetical protein